MDLTHKIQIFSQSDTGVVRDHNEDFLGHDITQGLVILADGMGGYKAGEVASEMAVNTILSEFNLKYRNLEQNQLSEGEYSAESLLLKETIELASQNIHISSSENSAHSGMGTTIVSAVFHDNKISIAHVGDSRLYRFRDNQLNVITLDHSLIQELIAKGFYTVEEARESNQKNLVTRALGVNQDVMVELQEDIVLVNDFYLFCSDGLNDMLEDQEIEEILRDHKSDPFKAVEQLIEGAKNMGGKDNVSVILVTIEAPFPSKANGGWFNRLLNCF